MLLGRKCNIDYAVRTNGSKPAKEFVESLNDRERLRFAAILQQLTETGIIANAEKLKKLRGRSDIWEFKSGKYRLFCFKSGRTWVLTNGFRKETNRTPTKYTDLAIRIMKEHLAD